jgi:predicted Zn-dependent protease
MRFIRVAILALALAAAGWFALGAREAHELASVTGATTHGTTLSSARARDALDQLNSASTLNPDRHVDVLRATVLAESHQTQRAVMLLERVVQAEPMNLEAWYALAKLGGSDQSLESRALRHILLLVPSLRPRS